MEKIFSETEKVATSALTIEDLPVIQPSSVDDLAAVVAGFVAGIDQIIDLTKATDRERQRAVDFLSGLASSGEHILDRIETWKYLLSPQPVKSNEEIPALSKSTFSSPAWLKNFSASNAMVTSTVENPISFWRLFGNGNSKKTSVR
jgi:FtsZ-interacting cell division protein YlmF